MLLPQRWRTWLCGVGFLIVMTMLVTSCSTTRSTSESTAAPSGGTSSAGGTSRGGSPAAGGGTFIFAGTGDPSKLDPAVVTDGESFRVTRQIYDNLVQFDGSTVNIKPGLAEKWTVSADGKEWTLNLRQGVKFHDGTPLDAEAVKFNFDRWHDENSPYHKGGQFDYWNDTTNLKAVFDKATVESPTTIKVSLKAPQPVFLNNLALSALAIGSPTAIKADVESFGRKPVGSGAFKFVEWIPGDKVSLDANKDYWGEKPKVDKVIIRVIKDNAARLQELKAGTIQGMEGGNPDDLKSVQSDPNLKVINRPSLNIAYINLNFAVKPLDDVRVRQAIAMAINKKAIVDSLYGGTGQVASQFLPPAVPGYNPDIKDYEYSVDKAKQLLKDAGYPDGFSVEFWYMPVSRPYYPAPKQIAEAFAADLAKVGIKTELKTEDWTQYLADRKEGKFPMWMLGWTGDTGDADNFYFEFFGKLNKENSWDNPDVRDKLAKAQQIVDQNERQKLYKEVAVAVNKDVPRIPIANTTPPLFFRKSVDGYVANPTSSEFFNTVTIK